MKRTTTIALTAMALLLFMASRANADGITYTETNSSMTGTIGATPFTNAPVTVTFVGDTANVIIAPVCPHFATSPCIQVGTATITIGGVGTFTFTDQMEVFVNQTYGLGPVGGVSDITQLLSIVLITFNSAFATYDLTTAIGPLAGSSGTAEFGQTLSPNANTTGGVLNFTSDSGTSTFTAITPEPGSLLLLGTSLSGLALFRRRRET